MKLSHTAWKNEKKSPTKNPTKQKKKLPPPQKNKKIPKITLNAYFCYCLSCVRIMSPLYSFLPLKNNVALATFDFLKQNEEIRGKKQQQGYEHLFISLA